MRPVLLIGHDDWETFGVAPATLRDSGTPWIEHLAHTGAELPPVSEISGIVLYGGAMNVDMTDAFPFLDDERRFLGSALGLGVPYLGICLGGQMLARALGHPVYSAGIREFGFKPLYPTPAARDDPLFCVFADGDVVFHWHEDTFELPEGATLLATGDDVHTQAIRYGETAWGTQFHFEIDRPEIELWLKTAGDDEVRAWGKTSEEIRTEAERHIDGHEERARALFRRFWDVVRLRSEDAGTGA